MKIFILGIGHMGSWLTGELSKEHDIAVYDIDAKKLAAVSGVEKIKSLPQIREFDPDIAINAVVLKDTKQGFDSMLPYLADRCIISDIASVKAGLSEYYDRAKRPFVSTHPMFGPTFANVEDLRDENAIIIKESDERGKEFFKGFYKKLGIKVFEYSFKEHDETIGYSLATPFASSIAFAACMKEQEAPGTTFRKHREIAKGLLSEDDYLLSEILFSPHALKRIEEIASQLAYLTHIIRGRDYDVMKKFLNKLRDNIK